VPNESPGPVGVAWWISTRSSAARANPGTRKNEATTAAKGEPFIVPPRSEASTCDQSSLKDRTFTVKLHRAAHRPIARVIRHASVNEPDRL
jgi:hypothetical protein